MASDRPTLTASVRADDETGSRRARRLRRAGRVPGVVYSGGREARPFTVDARELGQVLGLGPALLDLQLDGEAVPVVVKERQTHPVRGEDVHIDFYAVDLTEKIQSTVYLILEGVDDAPGVKEGGVLEQPLRELTVESLPTAIPEQITHAVGEMVIGDTLTVADLTAPEGAEILDDPETTIATLNPPRLEVEPETEVEEEVELVGEEVEGEEAPSEEGEGETDGGEPEGEGE